MEKIQKIESYSKDNMPELNEAVKVLKGKGSAGIKVVKDNGEKIALPSITKILSSFDDKEWLKKWYEEIGKDKAQAISRFSAHRGSVMHQLIDWYFEGMTDPEEIHEKALAGFGQFTTEEKECGYKLFLNLLNAGYFEGIDSADSVEENIYCLENGGFWGRTDFVCTRGGKRVVVDFKSSRHANGHANAKKIDKYKKQLAGYWLAWRESYNEEVESCELWISHEDIDEPDKVVLTGTELKEYCDTFLAMVQEWHDRYDAPVEKALGISEQFIKPFGEWI